VKPIQSGLLIFNARMPYRGLISISLVFWARQLRHACSSHAFERHLKFGTAELAI